MLAETRHSAFQDLPPYTQGKAGLSIRKDNLLAPESADQREMLKHPMVQAFITRGSLLHKPLNVERLYQGKVLLSPFLRSHGDSQKGKFHKVVVQ